MESGFIRQLSEELRLAKAERDEADRRADELFSQLTDLRAEMTVMTYKQQLAEEQIAALTEQLAKLMEANDAQND